MLVVGMVNSNFGKHDLILSNMGISFSICFFQQKHKDMGS